MKIMTSSDPYQEKIKFWARNPKVVPLPEFTNLPKFGVKRFSSYEEMNQWKDEYLKEIARAGGLKWK